MIKNKEDDTKKLRQKIIAYTRPFNVISSILGVNPITIRGNEVRPHGRGSIAYILSILALVLVELVFGIMYLEIIQSTTQYNIINLTHLFHVFAENIISCVCLINAIIFSKMATENFNSTIRVQQLMCHLGIEYDWDGQRNIGIRSLLLAFGLLFPLMFGSDYYLFFRSNMEPYYSFTSWLFMAFHVCFNAFAMHHLIFTLQIMKNRFKLLNDAVRDLNKISVKNIISEVHFVHTEYAKMFALPLKERVQMIKEAHDRLYRICAKGWISQNQVTLLEIVTCGILITSALYIIIGMVIDEQYDMSLLIHCCYWTVYKALVIVILVLSNAGVCTQCNQMALVIHDLLNRGETKDVYIQLKNFSLQRLHQKLKIMACGLFPVDYSLLFDLTGSITTHLVILIQFKMLGDTNKPQTEEN